MTAYTKEMIFGSKKKSSDNIKENEEQQEKIVYLDMDKMVDFREGQPFSMHKEEKARQMKESISRLGILSPILVRKIENEQYEILAGRHRVKYSKELGNEKIPSIIKDVDDDMARLIMLETNLYQREDIPPCEKGLAYKLQLETLKKIREKSLVHSEQVNNGDVHDEQVENLDVHSEQEASIDIIASKSSDSRTTIQRLIRLSELIEPLQEKVNIGEQISLMAGVELSYINPEEQEIINKFIEEKNIKISKDIASNLRSMKGTITEETISELFIPKEKVAKFTGKINKETVKKYKKHFKTNDDFNDLVSKLLEEYFEKMA